VRYLSDGSEFMISIGGNLGSHLTEAWMGVLLTEVQRNQVTFQRGEEEWILKLGEKSTGNLASASPKRAPVTPEPTTTTGSIAPQRVLSRGDVEKNLKNLGFLITQLNVQPFFKNGQPSGFRISRIRPGSFVDKMGARNGDIIRSVNGKPVRMIKDAFLLYNSFKTDSSVQIEVMRGGKMVRMGYQIR
jgi:general secretion pathway protein C